VLPECIFVVYLYKFFESLKQQGRNKQRAKEDEPLKKENKEDDSWSLTSASGQWQPRKNIS